MLAKYAVQHGLGGQADHEQDIFTRTRRILQNDLTRDAEELCAEDNFMIWMLQQNYPDAVMAHTKNMKTCAVLQIMSNISDRLCDSVSTSTQEQLWMLGSIFSDIPRLRGRLQISFPKNFSDKQESKLRRSTQTFEEINMPAVLQSHRGKLAGVKDGLST